MFKSWKALVAIFFIMNVMTAGTAASGEELDQHLAGLSPFLGKTWKGELKGSGEGKPAVDVSHWERALNGKAVRVLHSVNGGEYGGESLIVWDSQKNAVVYYYFTTAGFYTQGTMNVEPGKYSSVENVTGNANGITQVKATGEVTSNGEMITKSQYLQNGKWVDGHGAVYTEDSTAQIIFK